MNVLFLSGHLPSPNARQAGQKISYYLCEYLARRHSVQLAAFATVGERESWNQDCERIFPSPIIFPVTGAARLLGVGLAPHLPLSVAARHQLSVRRALAGIQHKRRFDVVIFDHMATWQYAGAVQAPAFRVGIAHDVLSDLWSKKAKHGGGFAAWLESRRLRRWERNAIRSLDLICTLNNKDAAFVSQLGEGVEQCVLQPWFSRPPARRPAAGGREGGSLVFLGAFDRNENVDAVHFAINDVLARVTTAAPQCTLYVTGFASELLPLRLTGRCAVQVKGFLPDLPAFLSQMQIALLPMRLGAGIKIKVLECMAAGLPVVTTATGTEGIPGVEGVHFVVGHTAEELAGHVISLLHNEPLRARIGRAAREFIRTNYDFEASAREFERLLIRRLNTCKIATRPIRGPVESKLPGIPCRRQLPKT